MTPHGPLKSTPAEQPGDDFRKIAGIGAAIERRLHDAGILTYQDLAACSPEQVAARLADVAGLSSARITSQDWTGQARRLAGPPGSSPESEPSQHYTSFHIELLLDVDRSVRRTKVHHHQSDTEATWPGWEEDRLLAYLREHIPLVVPTQPASPAGPQPSAAPARRQPGTAEAARNEPESASLPSSSLFIEQLVLTRESQRSDMWTPGEPTAIRFILRVSQTSAVPAGTLDFTANVTAHSVLGDNQRWPLGTAEGAVPVGEPLSVELNGQSLPRGLYRLETTTLLYSAGHAPDSQPLGGGRGSGALIQVAGAPAQNVSGNVLPAELDEHLRQPGEEAGAAPLVSGR